jgi:hypothetical protein
MSRSTDPLAIEQSLAFERREWRLARIAYVVLLVVMLGVGVGAFGRGPVSHARAGTPDSALWIDYERIVRFSDRPQFVVHAWPEPDGTVRVRLDRSLVDAFAVVDVQPGPRAAGTRAEGVEYEFAAQPGAPARIRFVLEAIGRWHVRGSVQTRDAAVTLSTTILP